MRFVPLIRWPVTFRDRGFSDNPAPEKDHTKQTVAYVWASLLILGWFASNVAISGYILLVNGDPEGAVNALDSNFRASMANIAMIAVGVVLDRAMTSKPPEQEGHSQPLNKAPNDNGKQKAQ